jgi:hypothetical protein
MAAMASNDNNDLDDDDLDDEGEGRDPSRLAPLQTFRAACISSIVQSGAPS